MRKPVLYYMQSYVFAQSDQHLCYNCIKSLVFVSKIARVLLVSVTTQTGLCFTRSETTKSTVRKHTPCLLSFVYTSYVRYDVRAVPNFGKHASLFTYHKDKKYV